MTIDRNIFRARSAGMAVAAAFALFVSSVAPAQAGPKVERVVSPQGIEAWLIEDHANPIISVSFAFRGGASFDPKGKEGLARMVSALLDEGAGDLDSQAFQRQLEDFAVRLSFGARRDTFTGRLQTLTKNRDAAFDLLRLAVTSPRFDAEPVERIRNQLIASLKQDLDDPGRIASLALIGKLFPGHPYGRPTRGTMESVGKIAVADLRAFVKERLTHANLVIGVVGDIRPGELGALMDKTFAGLPKTGTGGVIADVMPQSDGKTTLVRKPIPQSAIVFAQRGLKRGDPDYYTGIVLNHILGGGGFTSRLYSEVREKRGLAYSVGTGLVPMENAALLWGTAGTANARAGETLKLIRAEWQRMAREGVKADELNDAKTYLTGSFPLRFTSSGRIAGMLVSMQLYGRGIDYFEKRNELIEAVTLEKINKLAKRLLTPEKLSIVVVGDPEKI
ncbi:MAG: pitrilysin family protein [Rhodospirillales bacterium]